MLNLRGLKTNVRLAPYTTFKIGGPADYFITAHSTEELVSYVTKARQQNMPYFILGAGANILVSDKGFRGLVILNQADKVEVKGNKLMAESGSIVADLIKASVAKSLSGLEHFAGIPSSVGGAVWQNLHFLAPDRQSTIFIDQFIESAEILDDTNRVRAVDHDFFRFGYDDSVLHHKNLVVLSVTFRLVPLAKQTIKEQIRKNLQWRQSKQPQLSEYPSAGSVFKKIESVGAGRLIDGAGLKGKKVGKAQVSDKHANYIVNLGGSTASDVQKLMGLIQETVKIKTGYRLEPEISLVGDWG